MSDDPEFDEIWKMLDAQVASGHIPGYAAALRVRGQIATRTGGRMAIEPESPPVREDTLFRIASLTKPIGGALTMTLLRDGVVAFDDPIARWLPEAANPRVLTSPGATLDQTVEAQRPITVRHLLTLGSGWGAVLADTPQRQAMIDRKVYPGPMTPPMSGDEFVARLSEVPLAFQPGDGWLYDTGIDLLGVLLARATGRLLSELIAERITGPLGMESTAFGTTEVHRLATAYYPGPAGLEVLDPPDGLFSGPPSFEELSSGLVSTASDLLRFFAAMADGGQPALDRESVALMTADALTADQRAQAEPIVGRGASWGLGTGVNVDAPRPWMAPGRWGWNGGTGTTAWVDPSRDIVGVLMTQRAMTGPLDSFDDFWAVVAAA
ncbi:MAG: beta-lactamase family protein [Acidimicrobiaceae bacterium]|nr:beta-lactamase family protein [Acidimicrobiaceae bacterium]